MSDTVSRLTVNLIAKADTALTWLAEHTGHNRTDIVNRALQLYQYLEQATANGDKLALVKPDLSVQILHIL